MCIYHAITRISESPLIFLHSDIKYFSQPAIGISGNHTQEVGIEYCTFPAEDKFFVEVPQTADNVVSLTAPEPKRQPAVVHGLYLGIIANCYCSLSDQR